MTTLWRPAGGGGVLRDALGRMLRCGACPCGGGGEDCEHCGGAFPAEAALTISGVVGCEGRCDSHNRTLILPRWTLCGWGASEIFPQPDEPPESPCAVLEGAVFGVVDIAIVAPGNIEVTIHDGVFGAIDVFSRFVGTFSGPCSGLSLTLSGPVVETIGTMVFACPGEGCEGWCDWSAAVLHVEAL